MFQFVREYGVVALFFFFSSRRRHTRLQGDWSSDVCSSDLPCPSACPRSRSRGVAVGGRYRLPHCQPLHPDRSEEHTSELQSPCNLVCRLLLEKKKYICYIWLNTLSNIHTHHASFARLSHRD